MFLLINDFYIIGGAKLIFGLTINSSWENLELLDIIWGDIGFDYGC